MAAAGCGSAAPLAGAHAIAPAAQGAAAGAAHPLVIGSAIAVTAVAPATGSPQSGGPAPAAVATVAPTVTLAPTATPTTAASPVLPVATATATATASQTAVPPTATPVLAPALLASDSVNVRRGPGTVYGVIGVLLRGDTYLLTGKNRAGDWLQFDYRGTPGWVRADLVAVTGNQAAIGVAQNIPAPPTPAPTQPAPSVTPVPPAAPSDPVIADLVARINQARQEAGLNPLAWSPALEQAAAAHAGDMASHHFFDHTGSDGSDVVVRMQRAGYQPVYWGEVLTHVNGGAGEAFGQYWGSPHHHDILLGGNFRDVGAAWIRDPADGQFNYFAVVFGRRK